MVTDNFLENDTNIPQNVNNSTWGNISPTQRGEETSHQLLLIVKFTCLIIITTITVFFGFLPLIWERARKSTKLIGLANAFSGGLFMGIALFHLLPEACEGFEDYYHQNDPGSKWKKLPNAFFIAFGAYSFILLIEKVAFDSHSLTEHDHGGHEHAEHHSHKDSDLTEYLLAGQEENGSETKDTNNKDNGDSVKLQIPKSLEPINEVTSFIYDQPVTEELLTRPRENSKLSKGSVNKEELLTRPRENSKLSKGSVNNLSRSRCYKLHGERTSLDGELLSKTKDKGYEDESEGENSSGEDLDAAEETMKNVVSSKGKFASYLQARNIMQSPTSNFKVDKSLLQASKILERAQHKRANSIDRDCVTNINLRKVPSFKVPPGETLLESDKLEKMAAEVEEHVHATGMETHHFNPKSNMTPYILLIALSVHGLFEGSALGVQKELNDTLFLGIAILAHKWAESFTLGISFFKSNTARSSYIRMILLFSVFTPLGILLGVFVIGADPLAQGVFLATSAGTFLYISASEVIVEEFAITKYKYQKYFLYLCGGLLVGILSFMEVQNSK